MCRLINAPDWLGTSCPCEYTFIFPPWFEHIAPAGELMQGDGAHAHVNVNTVEWFNGGMCGCDD